MSQDWNPTTHMTWQTSTASYISPKMKDRIFLKRFANLRGFHCSKSVLGNLDLYSGTWICTREPRLYSFMYSPVLVFVFMAQYRWLIRYMAFLGPHTYLRQHKEYCQSAKIEFSDLTHPCLCWRKTWMVPKLRKDPIWISF